MSTFWIFRCAIWTYFETDLKNHSSAPASPLCISNSVVCQLHNQAFQSGTGVKTNAKGGADAQLCEKQ
jgi:nitrite reductase/ring-hydroxylating ferredoxin subunit